MTTRRKQSARVPPSLSTDVYIRADANNRIGWGHVIRSSVLAESLQRAGFRVTWLVHDCDEAALRFLHRTFDVLNLEDEIVRGSATCLPSKIRSGSWIIIDRYGWGMRQHRALRAKGLRVLCIDDLARGTFGADLVLNQNLGAEKLRYRAGSETRLLLGSRYALLRKEFRNRSAPNRPVRHSPRRFLVTFGGSDPQRLTPRVCRVLSRVAPEGDIRVVLGPSAAPLAEGRRRRVVRGASPATMRRLMEWCDVAITSPSSTCWELAYMGVPTAILGYARNQRRVAAALEAQRVAWALGWHDRVQDDTLAAGIAAFLRDEDGRARMARRARRAVDGRGVLRVLEAMSLS